MDFKRGDSLKNSTLVMLLMNVKGVDGVFLGSDYITIRKDAIAQWNTLKPEVFGIVMDYYATNKPVVTGPREEGAHDSGFEAEGAEDSEIVLLIKELLEERIRPMVNEDGGDIFFKGFDEESGVVTVELAGSCSGCPSSTVTLKQGVENMLMHYIPEVKAVHSLGDMDEENDGRSLHFVTND